MEGRFWYSFGLTNKFAGFDDSGPWIAVSAAGMVGVGLLNEVVRRVERGGKGAKLGSSNNAAESRLRPYFFCAQAFTLKQLPLSQ